MNTVKTTVAKTKKFVVDHKVALTALSTATVALYLHVKVIDKHNDFLAEHGLIDAFYKPED